MILIDWSTTYNHVATYNKHTMLSSNNHSMILRKPPSFAVAEDLELGSLTDSEDDFHFLDRKNPN